MTLVTPHFHWEEFSCKDGTDYPQEWREIRLKPLCEALEVVREKCGGFPVTITSGYRTPEWNSSIGGAADSRHLHGDAADFMIPKVNARHVFEVVAALQDTGLIACGGLAYYAARVPWTHVDIRGRRTRWDGNPNQVPL